MHILIITVILIIRHRLRVWTTHRDLNFLLPSDGDFCIFPTFPQLLNSKSMLNIVHRDSINHRNSVIFLQLSFSWPSL